MGLGPQRLVEVRISQPRHPQVLEKKKIRATVNQIVDEERKNLAW